MKKVTRREFIIRHLLAAIAGVLSLNFIRWHNTFLRYNKKERNLDLKEAKYYKNLAG